MTTTLILSDVHLDPGRPEDYAIVESVIAREAIDALWILGDLFEAWVGDDGAEQADLRLAAFLCSRPYPVYWTPGNRDFLVGAEFGALCGWISLSPSQRLNCGLNLLVRHGDEWCTDDTAYQRFRAEVRTPAWQQSFLQQPLTVRRSIAQEMRQASQLAQTTARPDILDVTEHSVRVDACDHDAQLVIHGHTHRPGLHLNRSYLRAVTSDWHQAATVIRLIDTASECRVEQVVCDTNRSSVQATATWQVGSPEWNLN